ncbi:MAG: hypothetical protein WD066_15495 [Planctomycetaceae bacterium]
MDFDKRLERAIERGSRTREEKSRAETERELSEEELRNLYSKYRLDISDHIEDCLRRLAEHFPGFRMQTVVGEEGWGARISRDDLDLKARRDSRSQYSRLELLITPFGTARIIELLGKGTIRNKEVFNRRHYQLLAQTDTQSFQETIDLWVLEYAEAYAART